ncbi:MAG: excinuclease ABC subunit UvrB [Candidatus Firestonebacteria bacterium]|nr:excinuclease ABC subunit UvrB [Candidatus Firestonebacteria bacterium]
MSIFKLVSDFSPCGDQPGAIEQLTKNFMNGAKYQTLLGVTGSGKTFTAANVIQNIQKPTLVISHNKTLAAQLYSELKEFFPHNAVEYFVSYYDYYQPEAYIPSTDTYIEKDASINDEIDRLRLSATSSLMMRKDVIVVSSVSCIYGLGSPSEYKELMLFLKKGDTISRQNLFRKLINIHYERNDFDFKRGVFRVRGDAIDIFPAYGKTAVRIECFGDEIERIREFDPLTGKPINDTDMYAFYPAKHFVTTEDRLKNAILHIEKELEERVKFFRDNNKLLEAERIETRTRYDIELMIEMGYCSGIENYSRHISGRNPGESPSTLLDYFPLDFFLIIDESHATIPQLNGMYNGDRARKESLIEFGFRLPSAFDNRPLYFKEFEKYMKQVIFVSATPAEYEIEKSKPFIVEQLIRPTGLCDPVITVLPVQNQVDDLVSKIKDRIQKKERVLVTTLTKRMAEDLAEYIAKLGIQVRYLHSEIETIERSEILKDLRLAKFDVLVGINLLREGLDLPEVSLVAILDADKEGFLRSERSLIQVGGRAARNVNGEVIMYADNITNSIRKAIAESERRRNIQMEYNRKHNITPQTIHKNIYDHISSCKNKYDINENIINNSLNIKDDIDFEDIAYMDNKNMSMLLTRLEKEMKLAARKLEFEKAARIRDKLLQLKNFKR